MINLIIWIIAGALIGWAASSLLPMNDRDGFVSDIAFGIAGALMGGHFLTPLISSATINEGDFSIPALLVSLGGAIFLLLFTKLFHNIRGYLVFFLSAMGLFVYFDCWTVASTSAFCSSVRGLPFLP